jgi:hypothetical protein
VISGAVHNRRESKLTKGSAPADHPAAVPAPSVSQHNNSPGWPFGIDTPDFEHPPVFSGEGSVGDLPPIRFILHRIPWQLKNKIREAQGNEQIENTSSENERKQSQLSRPHSECNNGMGMPLK